MKQNVYIFIGQSGSGKGTQVELLKKKIEDENPSSKTYHLQTGEMFRALAKSDTHTGSIVRDYIEKGKLPPAFLGIHAWSHLLIENYDGTQSVFIDGSPRVESEVPALLSLFSFYDWFPHVFYIQVSDEWAYDKLVHRGRADDKNEQEVWGRIQWFHESVIPAIEALQQSDKLCFHTIQGEQSIEAVHKDICEELGI